MTTNPKNEGPSPEAILPDELLLARDRVAQHRARALRSIGRGQTRRRYLPAAIVGSAVLVTAGLADRFVQGATQHTTAAIAATVPAASPASTNTQALAQVARTLAADQQAIAALAKAQSRLAQSAGQDGGGSVALPSVNLPSLPALPSLPSISTPTVSASAPPTHATTGASVVVH